MPLLGFHVGRTDDDRDPGGVLPGEDAESPSEIPVRGWVPVLKRTKNDAVRDNTSLLAGGVAFFALLALVPLLVAALSIWGLFASPADATRLISDVASGLPRSAQTLITQQLRSISRRSNAGLGVTAIVSLAIALWSASSGSKHLIEAVNVAYDEQEGRGFMRVRLLAILFTLGAIVFLLFSVVLIAVLPSALRDAGVPDAVRTGFDILRWPVLAVSMMVSLSVVYRVAPDRRDPKWRWVSWGAVTATMVWIVGSAVFALYTSNLGHYDQTYGSLGGVVVVMLWLYLTALVAILGAELNAELERQTSRDSTVGRSKPRGQRNAQAADALAEP
jgi:membrane protein